MKGSGAFEVPAAHGELVSMPLEGSGRSTGQVISPQQSPAMKRSA